MDEWINARYVCLLNGWIHGWMVCFASRYGEWEEWWWDTADTVAGRGYQPRLYVSPPRPPLYALVSLPNSTKPLLLLLALPMAVFDFLALSKRENPFSISFRIIASTVSFGFMVSTVSLRRLFWNNGRSHNWNLRELNTSYIHTYIHT